MFALEAHVTHNHNVTSEHRGIRLTTSSSEWLPTFAPIGNMQSFDVRHDCASHAPPAAYVLCHFACACLNPPWINKSFQKIFFHQKNCALLVFPVLPLRIIIFKINNPKVYFYIKPYHMEMLCCFRAHRYRFTDSGYFNWFSKLVPTNTLDALNSIWKAPIPFHQFPFWNIGQWALFGARIVTWQLIGKVFTGNTWDRIDQSPCCRMLTSLPVTATHIGFIAFYVKVSQASK